MRSFLLLSMLLIVAVGCEDAGVAVKDNNSSSSSSAAMGIPLDEVDAVGLESVLAANSMTLIDFTAVW